ncbi:MAG: hypothetical protein A2Z04_08820 [Chloroflexi bacterium RBG_16_57_9]|nr:MAG: hypothetical protein A2Z04_08820 [Chloroflexi bacterium RBG_16_57_9]
MGWRFRLVGWLMCGVVLAGCGGARKSVAVTVTVVPTDTPVATATATPTEIPYASGGLGQDRAWWERLYGPGENTGFFWRYRQYDVLFADEVARHIEQVYTAPMAFVGAQREVRRLLPDDAEFVELSRPEDRPGTWIELYESASLAARYGGDMWPQAEPGQFVVVYKLEGDLAASRGIVATGNDP